MSDESNIREMIPAYVAGRLDAGSKRQVDDYLARHPITENLTARWSAIARGMREGQGGHIFSVGVPLEGKGSERRGKERIYHACTQGRGHIGYGEGDGVGPHHGKGFFGYGVSRPCPYF